MRFAVAEGRRVEAAPGQGAICPSCERPMVARCGARRVWHWAHKRGPVCDGWWQPETQWHRAWKDNFPVDWQEYICEGDGGERHIADILTPHGLVIEFQHSSLPDSEQAARETFYRNMVWVVDGTVKDRNIARFLKLKDYFHKTPLPGIWECSQPGACFPGMWLGAGVLVVFDFGGDLATQAAEDLRDTLCCVFPGHFGGKVLVAPLPRADFIRMAHEQNFIFDVEGIIAAMEAHYQKEKAQWFGREPGGSSYGRWRRWGY